MINLCVKVSLPLGVSHEEWAGEVLELAKKLDCGVEAEANLVMVQAYPDDTIGEIVVRYHKLRRILEHI